MLIPSERLIVVCCGGDERRHPTRRHRFTIAHELGHWICHAHRDVGEEQPTFCRSQDLSQDADRDLEREANVFGAELLMPEAAVREAWAAVPMRRRWRRGSRCRRWPRSGGFYSLALD